MRSALLVNVGSPEMDRLAAEIDRRGALLGMVRRYVNKQRAWERALQALPLFGRTYAATLGRRLPPSGLAPEKIMEAGVVCDYAYAAVIRADGLFPVLGRALSQRLLQGIERGIVASARRHVGRADVVVANYHVAMPVFEAARIAGRRAVLNYPIAHHRWQYRFYAEQARLRPDYAAALPDFGDTDAHAALLDREIELADDILVGSAFVKETFVSVGISPSKLHVVPYGADLDRFSPSARARATGDPFRVLFVGQIGERKGMSYLLDAYRRFQDSGTELHLVGNHVSSSDVYRRDRDLIRHTANVPQSALPALMREADVFVLPTLVEGLGMVVIEAMACGVPVIVTPHGPGEVRARRRRRFRRAHPGQRRHTRSTGAAAGRSRAAGTHGRGRSPACRRVDLAALRHAGGANRPSRLAEPAHAHRTCRKLRGRRAGKHAALLRASA